MKNKSARKNTPGKRRVMRKEYLQAQATLSKDKGLIERNRITLAYLELGNDTTFQKLPEECKLNLIKEVIAIGEEAARRLLAEYGTRDPRKIAASMGLKVFGEDKGKSRGSEYRKNKREIVVFRNFHEHLVRKVKDLNLMDNLLKLLVAHELFHHLEVERIGEIYRQFKFRRWKIGPFVIDGYVKGLSNVAAQAFTVTLLGLEISPQVFDYLAYILYTNR